MCSPAQVLMDLTDKLITMLTAMVNPADQARHDAEVAQLKLDMVQAKEDLAAEDVRITAERAALDAQAQRIQAQTFRLTQDQNASNEVMRRRYQKIQSRLPWFMILETSFTHLVQGPVTSHGSPRVLRQTGLQHPGSGRRFSHR